MKRKTTYRLLLPLVVLAMSVASSLRAQEVTVNFP